jgi:hypothetical protein
MNDEFYIGWQAKAPPGFGSWMRRLVVMLFVLAGGFGLLLAAAQGTIGVSVFEWGKVKTFSGLLKSQPYPHLLVPRPGQSDGPNSFSAYYLVAPFKFGLKPETVAGLDGKSVTLQGTLIYRGNQTMIEVKEASLRASDTGAPQKSEARNEAVPGSVSLGRQTLIGEIVDSKCYLGVMNPGRLTPHRACAIRCISGGIPPVLLVRQPNGAALYFLLVSAEGRPVNKQVLNLVAEPVEITGEIVRQGELLILRSDPSTFRRVAG